MFRILAVGQFHQHTRRYDGDAPKDEEVESTCNTQKHHGAKMCHTSCGILLGVSPCGVIPLFEELFGSESKSQVFALVTDFLGEVNPKKLEYLIYDDACHLGNVESL